MKTIYLSLITVGAFGLLLACEQPKPPPKPPAKKIEAKPTPAKPTPPTPKTTPTPPPAEAKAQPKKSSPGLLPDPNFNLKGPSLKAPSLGKTGRPGLGLGTPEKKGGAKGPSLIDKDLKP